MRESDKPLKQSGGNSVSGGSLKRLKRSQKDNVVVNPSYEDIVAEERRLIETIKRIIRKRKYNNES